MDTSNKVPHSPALLDALLAGSSQTGELWNPASYWQNYANRIIAELRKSGMTNVRTNQRILKGYAGGGILLPQIPQKKWKQVIWHGVENAPVVRTILDSYKKINRSYHQTNLGLMKTLGIMFLNDVEKKFPHLKIPDGLANGGAECFEWKGHMISPDWPVYLARAADFYTDVPPQNVTSIMEIGHGLGLSTLAHIALNPYIRTIVNVDIVPTIYVSTQFLRSFPEIEVVDYLATKDLPEIVLPSNPPKPVVFQLPPWELSKVKGEFDYFFNSYSFMEMEKGICRNYAKFINAHTRRGAYLHSVVKGHAIGAGGQGEPVNIDFIQSLFEEKMRSVPPTNYFWNTYFSGDPADLRLMQAK